MSTLNPELAAVLQESPAAFNYKEHWENKIAALSKEIARDLFTLRTPQYSRTTYTVAGLLMLDQTLRAAAIEAGIELRAFDNIVGQVQQLILTNANKPITGAKFVKVLRENT